MIYPCFEREKPEKPEDFEPRISKVIRADNPRDKQINAVRHLLLEALKVLDSMEVDDNEK